MKKIVLYLISICLLSSCESKKPDVRICGGKTPGVSVLKAQEWFPFIDSTHTVSFIGKVTYLDSVSKYFMKVHTPNVISKPKYIFWYKGKQISNGEFAFFEQVSDSLMVIGSNGKRNVLIEELRVGKSKLQARNRFIFDMNNVNNEFKNACYEITDLNHSVQNQGIKVSIHICNSCSDEMLTKNIWLKKKRRKGAISFDVLN